MTRFTLFRLSSWSGVLVRRSWLVTLATVIVCAGFAAHAATSLVDARYVYRAPERIPGPAPPLPAPTGRLRPDGDQLISRNMFCSTCLPGVAGAGLPVSVVMQPGQATLIATSVGRVPYATLVIAATAAQGAWGVGDAIPGIGRLDRIAPTWIEIVDGSGRRGRLSLLDAAADRGAGTAMPVRPSAAAWSERITRIDETTYEVDRSLVRELVTGATRPGRMRPVPVPGPGGMVVRLFGVGDDSIPAAVGLATGDTLTAVNGAPIQSLQQLFDLYAGLDQLTTVEVSGIRNGKPIVRTLRLR